MKKFDIDLVYLWCDGNDKDFVRQKRERMQQCGAALEWNKDCRYVQIDELKYSLRSVAMYMPWIHHIFIVTNNQVPKWLKQHENITIVDHAEILPDTALPCFNSQALECCLHKIPNLAEHFIYANDDCFIGRKVSPSFFFVQEGKPIIRWKKTAPFEGLYWQTLQAAYDTIKQRFGVAYDGYEPHHNMDAYTKNILSNSEKEFPDLFRHTIHQPFRNESCMQRLLFHLYALVKKRAAMKDIRRTFFQRVLKKLGMPRMDSMHLGNNQPMELITLYNPALFCINDTELSTDEDRARTLRFLEKRFPQKSPYEREA